ncbi:MAG: AEC family transporter [Haloarculaceae archaeon]
MATLLGAFTAAVLPIVTVAFVGYLLGRGTDIDAGPLSTVSVYVLLPALVFHSLATTAMPGGTVVRFLLADGLYVAAMLAVAFALARAAGGDGTTLALGGTFSNAGNYGIPLVTFALGAVGRDAAVLYVVGQVPLMYTVGGFLAARGRGVSAAGAVRDVFRLPLVYAVVAAALARWLGVVPDPGTSAMRTVQLVGEAAIPVMLLALGVELAQTTAGTTLRAVLPAVGLKLLVAPVVAVGAALALGLSGVVADAFVLQSATPIALTPLFLVLTFEGQGEASGYLSTAVLLSTVGSVLTLPVVIWALSAGALG